MITLLEITQIIAAICIIIGWCILVITGLIYFRSRQNTPKQVVQRNDTALTGFSNPQFKPLWLSIRVIAADTWEHANDKSETGEFQAVYLLSSRFTSTATLHLAIRNFEQSLK